MDQSIRNRNRRHLAKALALGLIVRRLTPTRWEVQSESEPGACHQIQLKAGRWFCGCRWSIEHMLEGYDPRSNARPCKHILLSLAENLPAKQQDALMQADPGLSAAAISGSRIRAARLAKQSAAIAPIPAAPPLSPQWHSLVAELYG